MRQFLHTVACVAVVALAFSACNPDQPTTYTSLQVLSGANLSDTVKAPVSVPLALQLPSADVGASITFTPRITSARPGESGIWVCPAPGHCTSQPVTVTADSAAKVSMPVNFGTVSGPTWIDITSADGSIRDSVPYQTLPGTPVRLQLKNTIGVAYIGGTLDVGPRTSDALGNLVPGGATITPLNDLVSVSADGTLTGKAFGKGGAVYALGSVRDTVYLTVVPQGVLASIQDSGITLEGLDGIVVGRWQVAHQYLPINQPPIWLPGHQLLIGDGDHLDVFDSTGSSRPYAAAGTIHYPSLTTTARASGTIVMAAYDLVTSVTPAIYWIDSIGGTPMTLPVYAGLTDASVSPDGQQIAVVVGGVIKIADLRSGTFLRTLVPGVQPRWSPDGTMIAYFANGGTHVIAAGGGTPRELGTNRSSDSPPIWSPDSQWLLDVRPGTPSTLLNVTSGLAITLAGWTGTFLSPAWEP